MSTENSKTLNLLNFGSSGIINYTDCMCMNTMLKRLTKDPEA